MNKRTLKPGAMLYPLPAVLVTGGTLEEPAVMTAAWTGIICSDPPMCYVSIRPERYSYGPVRENMEFVINLTTADMVEAVDYAGCVSMRKVDKFKKLGFTKLPADVVKAPLIGECPLNLECRVTEIKELGSHHMFMAEIAAVHVDEALFGRDGRLDLEKAGLLVFVHGGYVAAGKKKIEIYGGTVMKASTRKKRAAESRGMSRMKARSRAVGGPEGRDGKALEEEKLPAPKAGKGAPYGKGKGAASKAGKAASSGKGASAKAKSSVSGTEKRASSKGRSAAPEKSKSSSSKGKAGRFITGKGRKVSADK